MVYPKGLALGIVVATAVLASLLELIDTTIVNVALRQIAGNIGASTTDVAWVITAYAISNVIIIPLSGMLSGLFGRKRYFTASIALFTAASLMCGLSTSLGGLVFWRFVQGIGGGGLLATSQTVVMEAFPPAKKGVALAIYGMSLTLGPAFGPTLGGFLTDHYSWNWAFFVNVPLGTFAAVSSWLYIADGRHEARPRKMDWWGIVFLAAFAGPLQFVLEEGNNRYWFDDMAVRVAFAVSMVSLVAFVARELRTSSPAVDLTLFASRNLSLGVAMVFVVGASLVGILYVYPLFAQIELGWDAEMSGLSIMPGAICTAFTIAVTRAAIAKGASPRIFTVIGFSLTALFCFTMSRQSTEANWGSLFGPLLLRGVALGFSPCCPPWAWPWKDSRERRWPKATASATWPASWAGPWGWLSSTCASPTPPRSFAATWSPMWERRTWARPNGSASFRGPSRRRASSPKGRGNCPSRWWISPSSSSRTCWPTWTRSR